MNSGELVVLNILYWISAAFELKTALVARLVISDILLSVSVALVLRGTMVDGLVISNTFIQPM